MARILIVEDDPIIRKLVAVNLAARGHEVIEASNGRQGLDHLRDTSPGMLLLDIKLPDISGWEILRLMAAGQGYPQIPVIVITAAIHLAGEDLESYKALRKVLVKPLDVRELTEEVIAALN